MKRPHRALITALIALVISFEITYAEGIDIATAGRLPFKVFTTQQGLPQNSVYTIAFDKKGYIWVGTQDGAAYYNGRNWTVVYMPKGATSNQVRTLYAGADGSMWFGVSGAGLYRLKNGAWTNFNKDTGLPSNFVISLFETANADGTTTMWVGMDSGGVSRIDNGRLTNYTTSHGLPHNIVGTIIETSAIDGKKRICVGTSTGAAWLDNDRFVPITETVAKKIRIFSSTTTIARDGSEELWFATFTGIVKIVKGQLTYIDTSKGLPHNEVYYIDKAVLPNGDYVILGGTYGGGIVKLENGRWTQIDARSGLPGNIVLAVKEQISPEGKRTLWAGLEGGGGLVQLNSNGWLSFDTKNGLPSNNVSAIMETNSNEGDSTYWVGTFEGGIGRFEQGKWSVMNQASGLPSNFVICILTTPAEDGSNIIWIGTDAGLVKLEKGKQTLIDTKAGLLSPLIITLLETVAANGTRTLWIGTYDGLAKYQNGKITNVFKAQLPEKFVTSLLETKAIDGSSTLWVGTDGGLASYRNGEWTTFSTKEGLPSNSITGLLETVEIDGSRLLWVATKGGLARRRLDSNSNEWQLLNVDTKPALPNNTVTKLLQDANKRIYVYTIKGITVLTPRTPTADDGSQYGTYTFTTEDGLPNLECTQGLIDSRGRIWVSTASGAALYDPSREIVDRTVKPLYVERALLNNTQALLPNASLKYHENNLIFQYALLSFHRGFDTRYRTQLVGLDAAPSQWTTDFKKEYTTLPAGDYIFKVWGRDYAGNISGPHETPFTVRPAPWRTWWAYLLYIGAFAFIGYGGFRVRLQALEKHNRQLEEKVAERTAQLDKKNEELDKNLKELAKKHEELIRSHQQAERIFSALSDVLPGTVLDGKYRLDSKIGAGGFGAVFRATHLSIKRSVAVKIFRPASGSASIDELERFQMEAVSTCRVNHPNAVSVLDSGVSTEGIAYIVMELLQGGSLASELKAKGKLTPERSAEIIIPVCNVLAEAHRAGIIHRDIKPDNIFLHNSPNGEIVKVVDFGIAKLMGDKDDIDMKNLTATGAIIGTPAYMPPERLLNKPYDGRADVYSVGIMLYEMLSGSVPFPAGEGGYWSVAIKHIQAEPPPLRELNAEVPKAVADVVMRALVKEPEERPTVKELAELLAGALGIQLSQYTVNVNNYDQDIESRPTEFVNAQQTADQAQIKTEVINAMSNN